MFQTASNITKLNSINFAENIVSLNSQSTLKEFSFDGLKLEDKVIIRTRNSQYLFNLLDPVLKLGLLSGGSLGNKPRRAFLLSKQYNKMLFLLEEKSNNVAYLCTSTIQTLDLFRSFS